jgi:hypothetical protein
MKRCTRLLLALGIVLLLPGLILAEEGDKAKDQKKDPDQKRRSGPRGRGFGRDRGPRGGGWGRGGPGIANLFGRLKLTDDQKKKVRELMKKHMEEYLAILTPEQKKALEEFRKGRRGRGAARGQRRPEGRRGSDRRPEGRRGSDRRPPDRRGSEKKEGDKRDELQKKLDRLMKELEELRRELRRR